MVNRPAAENFSSTPTLARRALTLAVTAVLATGGITALSLWRTQAQGSSVAPVESAPASVPATVTALGRLEPKGEIVKLSTASTSDGNRVDQLLVKQGDWVKAGQAIAILDNRDRLQATLAEAEEQVRVAQASLDRVKAGAKTGEIQAQKAMIARLEAERQTEITAQESTIARLEAERQTEITALEASLARIVAEEKGEVAAQQASIARLEAEVRNAEKEAERYEELYREGAFSEQTRDNKRLALKTTQEQLAEAEATLIRIRSSRHQQLNETNANLVKAKTSRLQQINEAKANLAKIETSRLQQINEASATLERIVEVRPVDVQVAQAEVRAAQASVLQAQANLDLAYIRAPKDGQILKIHTWPGEKVGNDGIAELGQTRYMEAVAEVYESDVQKVRLGQPAKVTSESFSGELHGTVEEIGLQVLRQNVINTDPSANTDSRIVEVRVRLDAASSQKVAGLTNLQVKVVLGR